MILPGKVFRETCVITVLAAAMSFIPREDSGKNKLIIRFENYADGDILKLDSAVYTNESGQAYTVTKFKYYIGNIHLERKDGSLYTSSEYFLVNEELKKSKEILLTDFPDGEYVSIGFMLGVDSLHNCSGAQTGALDPVNGMFWAWNTGYIFVKVEGKSSFSKSPGNIFEFHIGGYQQPNNCIRNITLDFGTAVLKSAQGKISSLKIKTNVSEIFKSPVTIDFTKLSAVTDARNATMVADNYSDMFSILKVD